MILSAFLPEKNQGLVVSVNYDPTDGSISEFEVLLHPGGQNITDLLSAYDLLDKLVDSIDWKEEYFFFQEDNQLQNHIKYYENENE